MTRPLVARQNRDMKIKLTLPIAAVILAACAVTADALIVDKLTGCAVHNPNPKSGEGITWSGECANGAAHGLGTVSWFLGGNPNGQFEGDLPTAASPVRVLPGILAAIAIPVRFAAAFRTEKGPSFSRMVDALPRTGLTASSMVELS